MKNKMFPFPILAAFGLIIYFFLLGSIGELVEVLVLTLVFLAAWYTAGPDMKPSSQQFFPGFGSAPVQEYQKDMFLWTWSKYLYEDRVYRNKSIAFVLAIVLMGTGLVTWLSSEVLLWRGILVMSLCALGLLALLIDVLLRRKRGEEADPTKYPAPEVNMNYDHEAAADVRVRALQQRLERLEEWQRSGMIDDKEYRKLRNQYLSRRDEET